MKTLHLHGDMARFGGPFSLDVPTVQHGVRLVAAQIPELKARIREGRFHVVHGSLDSGMELDEETIGLRLPPGEVHLIPAIQGSDSGFFNVILGAALIGFAVFNPLGLAATPLFSGATTVGAIAGGLGVSLALSGVAQLLAPTPTVQSNEPVERRPSALFNSLLNRTEAGNPVPLAFGRIRTGSVVGSAGIAVEEVPRSTTDSGSGKFLDPFS